MAQIDIQRMDLVELLFPLGVSQRSQNSDAGTGDDTGGNTGGGDTGGGGNTGGGVVVTPVIPFVFAPLQGTLSITESEPYISYRYDTGVEFRERKGLGGSVLTASFTILLNESTGEKAAFDTFFANVGSHKEFELNVPGAGVRRWYKSKPIQTSHEGGHHWRSQVELKSYRGT